MFRMGNKKRKSKKTYNVSTLIFIKKRCDKPFENSNVVKKMIEVCKENKVQFMDNVSNIHNLLDYVCT